jgi:hypothetical protein
MRHTDHTIIRTEQDGVFTRTLSLSGYGPGADRMAREVFGRFKDAGVITGSSFDDDTWRISDEKARARLRFSPDGDLFEKGIGTWCGCSAEDFSRALKAYTALQLGTSVLQTLRAFLKDVREAVSLTAEGLKERSLSPSVLSFFCFLPGGSPERDLFLDDLEGDLKWRRPSHSSRRELADFPAYLDFDAALDAFWESASTSEKVQWFPVWAWWHVTSVLPLRPTEFLLTPRDCIRGEPGSYTLTVRRTILKKKKGAVTYRVTGDYTTDTYTVPDPLAREILWYRAHSEPGPGESEERLLGNGKILDYPKMRFLLAEFVSDWLEMPAGAIHLADTRHLAMIGIIVSGGSPSVCRALAGHETISQSSWYYANISSLINSAVFRYRQSGKTAAFLAGPFRLLPEGRPFHTLPEGRCDAMGVPEGDISECLKNISPGSHLGECAGCPHFYPFREHQAAVITRCREAVDFDCAFLIELMDQIRKNRGCQETIDMAIDRLRRDCARYLSVLLREAREGMDGSGTAGGRTEDGKT